jgi:hypothetical protein
MVFAITSSGITLADPSPKQALKRGSSDSPQRRESRDERLGGDKDYDEPKDNEFFNFGGRFLSVMSAHGGSRTVAG